MRLRRYSSVRLRRYSNGSKRRPLIAKLRRAVGPAIASIVFAAGVLPATAYDAEINGVSDTEWRRLQAVAASAQADSPGGGR